MSDRKKQYFWEKKYDWDGPTLSGQKLLAWAFAIGARPRLPDELSGRRPHRGQLPDIDFDRAVVDPRRRPLWSRVADLVFGSPRGPADIEAELRSSLNAALGERLAAAYIGEPETGEAMCRKDDGKSDPTKMPRAA